MTDSGIPGSAARRPNPLPHGQVRIGDAEREGAAEALGEHFAAGRLDHDEFDARLSAAYAARSGAELTALFTDLPDPRPTAGRSRLPSPVPASAGSGRPVLPVGIAAVVFLGMVLLPLLVAGAWAAGHGFPPLLLLGLFWFWAGSRRHGRGRR